jgi:hypothetical protein
MRTLDAFSFLALMTVGHIGMKHPSLAGMVDAIGVTMTREAMHSKFTPQAEAFLETCLQYAVHQSVAEEIQPIRTALLNPFRRVLLFDSSGWDVDPHLADVFPGSGGDASAANCKLQVGYDYKHGELGFFKIDPGTTPDNAYTAQIPPLLHAGDLAIFDQGYFKLETLSQIAYRQAFFLTRFLVNTTIREAETAESIDLEKALYSLAGDKHQFQVIMGGRNGTPEVRGRLICLRVSEQAANERRRKLLNGAHKKGRMPSKTRLAFCDWTLLATNVSESDLPIEMTWRLYSLRWQIELLFKQLKSVLAIHRSLTRKNASRLKCEIYGKLIFAVLIHRTHAYLNTIFWNRERREISFDKFYKRFQERAFVILTQLRCSAKSTIHYLVTELDIICMNCLKLKQPSRQSTLEMLENNMSGVV